MPNNEFLESQRKRQARSAEDTTKGSLAQLRVDARAASTQCQVFGRTNRNIQTAARDGSDSVHVCRVFSGSLPLFLTTVSFCVSNVLESFKD